MKKCLTGFLEWAKSLQHSTSFWGTAEVPASGYWLHADPATDLGVPAHRLNH